METGHHGRVSVRAENAAAALEVMSRFAVDPRWLLHLPPTMSPVATSPRDGLLEHPDEAFAAFRADGVAAVVCEEKHMGSRALALVCRDGQVARRPLRRSGRRPRRRLDPDGPAVLRRPTLTAQLVDRLRAAAERSGLFEELSTGWLLLDAELLPWSAKALELLRSQYAAVGAAARGALPAAVDALRGGRRAGRRRGRPAGAHGRAVATTPRPSPPPTGATAGRRTGWTGVRFAPFQVLATRGRDAPRPRPRVASRRSPTGWSPPTRRCCSAPAGVVVDTTDAASTAGGVRWWEELTAAGGEGMVVKPLAGLVRGRRGLVQPGLKVRGREYLRIIYGPEYTEPANLARLRERPLGRKRSLALREYALGIEALERAARGEPLWRVHECVFGVLALESEPVDPRL